MTPGRYDLERLRSLAGISKTALQRVTRIGGRDWSRYWEEGVSAIVADRCAGRCGFHPAEVWPEWVDDGVAEQLRPCDECSAPFLPARKDARFCDPSCYKRWWAREVARRRRERPDLAERNRERRRRYYAENGGYERAREHRRYHANPEEMAARKRERRRMART